MQPRSQAVFRQSVGRSLVGYVVGQKEVDTYDSGMIRQSGIQARSRYRQKATATGRSSNAPKLKSSKLKAQTDRDSAKKKKKKDRHSLAGLKNKQETRVPVLAVLHQTRTAGKNATNRVVINVTQRVTSLYYYHVHTVQV